MANVCCQPRLAPNQRCQTARRDRQTDNRVSRSANRNCLSAARAFLVPAPQACVRVGRSFRAVSAPSPPNEGWMERRQAHSWTSVALARRDARACKARTFPVRPGPLSALHRGAFQPRTHAALPGSGTREVQRLPAPGRQCLAVGVRTSRGTVRAAAAGRHSPLRLQDRL